METFETQDMAFAAYLVHRGCQIAKVRRAGRRVLWSFQVEEGKLAELEAEWPSSDQSKYFNVYQTLKTQIRKI